MSGGDWLPSREQDLADLCQKWAAALGEGAKITACGWNPAECAEVLNKVNAFLLARGADEEEKTPENRIVKGEAVDAMREFANSSIRFNKRMDAPAKQHLGIHPKDTTPTPHLRPASQPDTSVENTRPEDACGVRYACQVGGEKPAAGARLPNSRFSRKTSMVIQHTEEGKGKTAYDSTCCENSKGALVHG